jgi:cell division septation protein DedD
LAQPAQDDGFHEIQLNGKQLVFLFMAATVVSVVIFLCGVLVGRGVRAERGGSAEATVASDTTPADITPTQPPVAPAAATADPTAAPPPAPAEDLSYFKRLEDPKQPQEDLKPAASKTAAVPAQAPAAQPAAMPAPPPAQATKNTPAPKAPAVAKGTGSVPVAAAAASDVQPPAAQGYAVQIAALNVRSEADAIAKHLTSKGYQAYVSANGTPAIYRVRIGTFKTRREAETVAAKLQKEEQLKPWVTR